MVELNIGQLKKEIIAFSLVASGAVIGALLRWVIQNDLLVNVFGSAILGFILGMPSSQRWKLFIGVGFCGAFTTFSGWIYDVLLLATHVSIIEAIRSISFMLVVGLLAISTGYLLGKQISC